MVEDIGLYEDVPDQDCKEGTPLGHAYEQGWNAALTEVLGRLRAAQRIEDSEQP